MEIYYILIQQLVMFFIMICMGYCIVKMKVLKLKDSNVLSKLIVNLVLPCALLSSFQLEFTLTIVQGLLYSFFLAFGVHVLFLIILKVLKLKWKFTNIEEASIVYSNTGNMSIPIIVALLGEEWLVYSCAYMTIQIIYVWTHGQIILSDEKGICIKNICCNVNIIAITIGIILFILQIKLPSTILITFNSLKALLAPLSMLVVGMLISEIQVIKLLKNYRTYIICMLRLIVMPSIVLIVFSVLNIEQIIHEGKLILLITCLAMTTPTSSTITQLAQLYNCDANYAGALNFLSTMLSIFTMPFMIFLFYWMFKL